MILNSSKCILVKDYLINMDQNQEQKKTPLASELPETKMDSITEPVIIDVGEKDYSHLPSGTQASIELDKKNVLNVLPNQNTNIKDPNNTVPKSVLKKDFSKKFFKIALGIFGVFALCFVIVIGLSVTNVDTKFVKITLNGKITDGNTGTPVENASIFINDKEIAKTNKDGIYTAANQEYGEASITVKADGYDDLTETVKITKVLLDYSTRKDFILKSSLTGILSGKFNANNSKYNFINDQLLIGDKSYKINEDGTFNATNVKLGETSFKFQSVSFKDIFQAINVAPGLNKIPDFTLTPTGDVIGELKSYIREDLVLNTKFYVENILQDQVAISEDGKFAIKDLETGKKYKIRVTADGYRTRDYEINITQGENELFNFKLVEDGVAVYPKLLTPQVPSSARLFKSDFDGFNAEQVNNDKDIDFRNTFYNIEDNTLYYQSSLDGSFKRESSGQNLNLPYKVDITSGIADRLTISTNNLASLTPNYVAKKMVNIHRRSSNQGKYGLQVMNIDGSARQDIVLLNDSGLTFTGYKISNNGNSVAYVTYKDSYILYLFNTQTTEIKQLLNSKKIQLFDVSEDGNLVLASRINPSTDLEDLILINSSTNDLRTLKENIKGKDYQFVKGSSNKVIFFEEKESRFNIYSFTIDQSLEERITSLTRDYRIIDIYQESNLVFYLTNRGLLVVDINKPKNFKLVSSDVFDYINSL